MVDLHAILSSRTAFEYGADEIRLSVICQQAVVTYLKDRFQFEAAEVATPTETFGPVAPTLPPGLILAGGGFADETDTVVPIRAILIDSRRVVIDVAAPSRIANRVFELFVEGFAGLRTPDEHQAIGLPRRSRTYSEVAVRSPTIAQMLHDGPIQRTMRKYLSPGDYWGEPPARDADPVGSVRIKAIPNGEEYAGAPSAPDSLTFMLDVRGGSTLEESLIYSIAPLDTDMHVAMLDDIEALGNV